MLLAGAVLTVPVVSTIDVMSVFAPEAAAPRLVNAAAADVAPVPPLATASVPPSVKVPDDVIGEPLNVRPVVPPDAATLLTVPVPPEDVIVKLGYVPVMDVKPPPVNDTIWSGAVLTTAIEPEVVIGPPETLMPVPAVKLMLVTVPPPIGACQNGGDTPPPDTRISPTLPDVGVRYSASLLEYATAPTTGDRLLPVPPRDKGSTPCVTVVSLRSTAG